MFATTPLVPAGTLPRPGPVGRSMRLALGLFCIWVFAEVARHAASSSLHPLNGLGERAVAIAVAACLFNTLVSIGWGRSASSLPLACAAAVLGLGAAAGWAVAGTPDHALLGVPLNLWLLYVYGHLGAAFVLAAVLATPGCELRAFADLFGRLRQAPADDQACPAAFMRTLDDWEARRRAVGQS